MFDSPLLCDYLDSLSALPRLIPRDGSEKWQVLRWEALADGMTDAAYNIVMERRRPATQQSAEWLWRWAADVERALQQMEARIGEIGMDVTLAHLGSGAAIGYLALRMPETLYEAACPQPATYPRLLQWYESFRQRPSMHIWTHPVLQDTGSFETRRRLLPYIRPVDANILSLALMNSARLDLFRRSASKEPLH
jgi:glutathione S-transferase